MFVLDELFCPSAAGLSEGNSPAEAVSTLIITNLPDQLRVFCGILVYKLTRPICNSISGSGVAHTSGIVTTRCSRIMEWADETT